MQRLEVIVVTYHSWDTAAQELGAMSQLAAEVPEVGWCFVDNSSGAVDAVELRALTADLPNVRFLELANPGFAAACNAAVDSSGAEWVLLLNPDVLITRDQLERIVAACDSGEERTIAVSMVTHGRRHAGVTLQPGWWFADGRLGASLLGPSGGAGVYPRRLFKEAGGMHEPLFAWGEDADLAWRLSRAGTPCQLLDLGLHHQGGHSVSGSSAGRRFKVRLLYRNRLLVARRNLDPVRYWLFAVIYALAVVAMVVRNAQRDCLRASFEGYLAGITSATELRGAR